MGFYEQPTLKPSSGSDDVNLLISHCDDILEIDRETKIRIKKDYKNWCRKIHPDKVESESPDCIYVF